MKKNEEWSCEEEYSNDGKAIYFLSREYTTTAIQFQNVHDSLVNGLL